MKESHFLQQWNSNFCRTHIYTQCRVKASLYSFFSQTAKSFPQNRLALFTCIHQTSQMRLQLTDRPKVSFSLLLLKPTRTKKNITNETPIDQSPENRATIEAQSNPSSSHVPSLALNKGHRHLGASTKVPFILFSSNQSNF